MFHGLHGTKGNLGSERRAYLGILDSTAFGM